MEKLEKLKEMARWATLMKENKFPFSVTTLRHIDLLYDVIKAEWEQWSTSRLGGKHK
jgi:hypothetical protein